MIAQPCGGVVAGDVEAAVDKAVVAQVDAGDLAQDHVVFAQKLDHLHDAAFEGGGGGGDAGAVDGFTLGFRDAHGGEFVGAMGEAGGGFVHGVEGGFLDDVDGEDA